MKVLLTDGAGLTSRQVSTILGRKGHEVHILCPNGITLTKCTKWVRKVHCVPPFGPNPYTWLTCAVAVILDEKPQLFICTQEQVAIISAEIGQIEELVPDIKIAVPTFSSLVLVIDKISARQTLTELDLPQPESIVANSAGEVASSTLLPAYIKTPIGTASTGVRKAITTADLERIGNDHRFAGSFTNGQLLVQKATPGPLLMICSIFSHGHLVAWHACLRIREGSEGGASVKSSLPLPAIQEHLIKLGRHLKWHGALSLDAILVDGSPEYIDINPRLVEPLNALYAGVDLVEALIQVSLNGDKTLKTSTVQVGAIGVQSHQTVIALIGAVHGGRLALLRELAMVIFSAGDFRDSTEELTPTKGDPFSYLVMLWLFILLLVHGPSEAKKMSSSAIIKYALTAEGWNMILANEADRKEKQDHS